MIVITSSPVVGPGPETIDARNPRIGWHNLVRFDNVFADEETDDEPVRNLANPLTYRFWRGQTTDEQLVQVNLDAAEDVDYFAIAKHNLGSSGAFLTFQSSTNGTDWSTVVASFGLNDDFVMIREFNSVFAGYFRLLITPGVVPPSIGVLYVGRILAMQRRLYVGHTPFPQARSTDVSSGRSENGQFLGRVLRREFLETGADFQNLTPAWFRTNVDPFIESARVNPFFWAWRPGDYPFETGFAWLKSDPQVSNQRSNGMMQMSFQFQGVR